MSFAPAAVIPARFDATRFPGKLLADLAGRPVLSHVVANALGAHRLARVIVATDHDELAAAAGAAGAEVFRSRRPHETGTDRVGEAVRAMRVDGPVVNIQADEPLLGPEAIDACVRTLEAGGWDLATLATPATDRDAADPAVVKVVLGAGGRALYFSRAPIPWSSGRTDRLEHVGIYAFTRGALDRFLGFQPTELERAERLEQLRALAHGLSIGVLVGRFPVIGIDTPEDLERARARLGAPNGGEVADVAPPARRR